MYENFENLAVSIDEFNTYVNDYEDSKEAIAQKARLLSSAQQIVEEYLGYPVMSCDRTETLTGLDQRKVYLHSLPVTLVYDVMFNKDYLSQGFGYVNDYESVYLDRKPCPKDEITVHYAAGWNRLSLPAIIKQSIMRIAALLKTEANGNIGLTSTSYGTDGIRNYLNFTNFQKYLSPLRGYKAVWI